MLNSKNVFIFHGAYGHSKENWFDWLKQELGHHGIPCIVPDFPTPSNQSLKVWLNHFKPYTHYVNKNSVFIGHSLGAIFGLRCLESYYTGVIAKTILVAPFNGQLGFEQFDGINQSFFLNPFNWKLIKSVCSKFVCIYSDNDPYVPGAHFNFFINNLNAESILICKSGHFNATAGYNQFSYLLNHLLNEDLQ